MIEAHRLAPVSEHEFRIGLLCLLEGVERLVELEIVQRLDAGQERRLRGGARRRREADGAKLGRLPA